MGDSNTFQVMKIACIEILLAWTQQTKSVHFMIVIYVT